MNILPKKSWHVRSKKNIDRVRRDEEKAAEEEKETQRRIALAEQEARTSILRKKNRKKVEESIVGNLEVTCAENHEQPAHVNFFKEIEEDVKKGNSKNKEHEAEKKAEKEKWEKSVGILTYLGQSSAELQDVPPWYMKKRGKEEEDRITKKRKRQDFYDPLVKMNEYLKKKKNAKHQAKGKVEKNRSKHKQRNKDVITQEAAKTTLEQLRTERMQRELMERQRTAALLAKVHGEKPPDSIGLEVPQKNRQYNSQYNPDLVSRSRKRN